jgi:hypothetical protein
MIFLNLQFSYTRVWGREIKSVYTKRLDMHSWLCREYDQGLINGWGYANAVIQFMKRSPEESVVCLANVIIEKQIRISELETEIQELKRALTAKELPHAT